MATIDARYCRKTNQFQSVQGYGRTHKIIFISPRNRRKVLPWQYLLPGIVEKLVSSNLCRGLECKEPTKRCLNPRNMKSVAKYPQNHNLKKNSIRDVCTPQPREIFSTP